MNPTLVGIGLMILTTVIFSVQDAFSRHLAERYDVLSVILIRYWFFALFVLAISARCDGGILRAATSRRPWLQIGRGVLLVVEIAVTVKCFVLLGLVQTHALFATFPLMVTALSIPILGERVGPRRMGAIAAGFVGMLIVLRPGFRVFDPAALLALLAAALFALYHVMTRLASRHDPASVSFFYTGIAGAVAMTLVWLPWFEPVQGNDWYYMGALCVTGATGHYLLIKALELAEASILQPFSYFQLVFASAVGVVVFGDSIDAWLVIGAAIIVGAGLFTWWREQRISD